MQLVSLALLGVWHPVELVPEPSFSHLMVGRAEQAVLLRITVEAVDHQVELPLMEIIQSQPPHQQAAQYPAAEVVEMVL